MEWKHKTFSIYEGTGCVNEVQFFSLNILVKWLKRWP